MRDRISPERARPLARGFFVLVALTFGLIVLGALVRANDAGLACPDWPQCFGVWLPEMDLRVGFEWTHRLVAGSISLVFLGLAVLVLRDADLRRRAGLPIGIATALLLVQIVLGGLTVLLSLAPWTVTAHLLTGNAFNAALLVSALVLRDASRPPGAVRRTPSRPVRAAVGVVALLLLLQMALGGLVSSNYAGLSCPDWPTCSAGVWFPSWKGPVGLHLLHRTNAYLVAIAIGAAAFVARSAPGVRGPLVAALVLVCAQVLVGIANVVLGLPVEITGLHSALAAGLVLAVTVAAHAAWRADTAPTLGSAA